jgi:CDP-6-deoxy-D-xylo-4-hexulose-3-dehydrase
MRTIPLGTIFISDKSTQNVARVLETKRLSYGDFCREFESRFAQLHHADEAIFCNSGTSALHTILVALKRAHAWQDGDEVLVPIVTFVATVNAVIHAGLKPVFVDIDSQTYALDAKQLHKHLSARTRAIMPVHIFGVPAELDSISEFAQLNNLLLVEDACEAIAATYKGKAIGSWGVAAAFSTHSAHIITTGIGGMITTSNHVLAEHMRSLINHGRSPEYLSIDDDNDVSQSVLQKVVDHRFVFDEVGFSYRISELEAAVGCSQLDALDEIISVRKENVTQLLEKLKDLNRWLQLPTLSASETPVLMAFPIVLTKAALKTDPFATEKLIHFLEKKGVETRPFLPILGQPAYANFGLLQSRFPVGAHCTAAGLYFGCHQDLTSDDLVYISDAIHSFFARW